MRSNDAKGNEILFQESFKLFCERNKTNFTDICKKKKKVYLVQYDIMVYCNSIENLLSKTIEKLLYFSNNTHKNVTIHADKLSLKGSNKYVALSILSIYYTWKNIKSNKNVKFKISDST